MKRFAGAREVAVPRSVPQEPCLIDGLRGNHCLPEAAERPQTSWVLAVVLDVLPGGIWPNWDPLQEKVRFQEADGLGLLRGRIPRAGSFHP
ncbi:Leukocyte Receptor Cluster Member 1 [Manis pentadactyla]|nr:Leukocyte Receptor Cluster Member 1 [Manis pentadactyla]